MIDFSMPRECSKLTFFPVLSNLKKKLLRRPARELECIADKTWEIASGVTTISRPAYFLPNQLERVTGTAYTPDPKREMSGGNEIVQGATRGFLLKNVWLIDGSIYKNYEKTYLYQRCNQLPQFRVECEIDRGAIYCTDAGLEFFGLWLTDDCAEYPLTVNEGLPITSNRFSYEHASAYETWFDMKPARVHNAFLREVVLFDDAGQNPNKRARFRSISDKLLSHVNSQSHPGVFILRGNSGKKRILRNELELAEHLRDRRGFRILDVTKADVPTIVATCAGARVVVGVEGSQLFHGLMVLQPGCALLVLQPPNRFTGVIKRTTDQHDIHFGFVVGFSEDDDFRIDPKEVERTLDLFPV